MSWSTSNDAFIWIFNVGRGSASFIRTPLNQGMIVDVACSSDFSTAAFIAKYLVPSLTKYEGCSIAQAILTHPHHDHINDCSPLAENSGKLYPALITCPNDKDPNDAVDWKRIKNRDGNKSLANYKKLYEFRRLPLQSIKHTSTSTTRAELEYGIYYVRPNVCAKLHSDDNQYGNSLSIVTYFRYGSQAILFPGDITPEAMKKILVQSEGVEKRFTVFSKNAQQQNPNWTFETSDQPLLKNRLKAFGLSTLIASHHGLESCYSPELYDAMGVNKPDLVVISELRAPSEGQGKIDNRYQSSNGANGVRVKIGGQEQTRYSVTTKSHHILIRLTGSGKPKVFCEEKIEDLMKWANT